MNIKETIFRFIAKRQQKQPRQAVYRDYQSVQSVLILFESEVRELNVQAKALVKQLQADGKEVTAWGYIDRKKATSGVLANYRVLGQSDYNLWGLPNENERQDLLAQHYDLLIDLNTHHLLPLRYLALYADADFKAGLQTEKPWLADFMISITDEDQLENPAFLFDQIIYYLKTVKSVAIPQQPEDNDTEK